MRYLTHGLLALALTFTLAACDSYADDAYGDDAYGDSPTSEDPDNGGYTGSGNLTVDPLSSGPGDHAGVGSASVHVRAADLTADAHRRSLSK